MSPTDAMFAEIESLWNGIPREYRPKWETFRDAWLRSYGDSFREALARGFAAPGYEVYAGIKLLRGSKR